jgi:hypothetical protein
MDEDKKQLHELMKQLKINESMIFDNNQGVFKITRQE